jgi:outer membrane protein OmpA-like peptidoglycan-associated protein
MNKFHLIITLVLTFTFTNIFAQDDAEKKCVDNPLLTHLKNFDLKDCNKTFDALDIEINQDKTKHVEGTLYTYYYAVDNDSFPDYTISWLQMRRNFENAIKKIGGKSLNTEAFVDWRQGEYFYLKNNNKEIYVVLEGTDGLSTAYAGYNQKILEVEAMQQELDANGIFNALNTDGHIALHINFETGKSVIQNESQKIVNDIFEMLQANADLKVSIEGHTDNVGNAAANKTLSESRAKAVMDALVAKGINKTRLSSKGWGSTKPVADNATEEGKAANRRVEIVKM